MPDGAHLYDDSNTAVALTDKRFTTPMEDILFEQSNVAPILHHSTIQV
jgi:hypothetical protein